MKKLTFLLFGLLLAVGWTSSAFAQSVNPCSAVYNAEDMTDWTYQWGDANGVTHTSYYINQETGQADQVTDKYQIYGLLKNVYMDKRFPGPYQTGYMKNETTRENDVYYGGMSGGWNIAPHAASGATATNVTISPSYSYYNTVTTKATSGVSITTAGDLGANYSYMNLNGSTIITAPVGYFITKIVFNGYSTNYPVSNLSTKTGSYTVSSNVGTWTGNSESVSFTSSSVARCSNIVVTIIKEDENYYRPAANNEGYTAIFVALYNDTTKIYPEPSAYWGSFELADSVALINYIGDNIQFVKVLTDGLRVCEGTKESGTIFNCDGYFNRFFILSKGQSRKKSTYLLSQIASGNWPAYCGEEGPFKFMFEEFSPTTGRTYSDVTDFYDKMMEGEVYNVIHDCASVIQNKHQFSMSGKKGTEYKPMSGLNFFLPDYRLLWWDGKGTDSNYPNQSFDGRDMNAYLSVNDDGTHSTSAYDTPGNSNKFYFGAFYAQYNQAHAPKMGIYKITLDAEAEQVAYSHDENNENFKVTLTWVSSLNEMSGHTVDQTYTVYYYDRNGNRQKLVVQGQTNTNAETHETTLVYYVPQEAHSYTIDYVVMGTPDDSEHPAFVAWSNIDGVTIPGWDDFLIFELDHHESDFVVKDNGTDKANWYRNFLMVENDLFNGITVTDISKGMNTFNIYRWDNKNTVETKMATLTFDNPTAERVHYTVTYDDNGTDNGMLDQNVYEPEGNPNKYKRSTMKIPDQGYVRVRGNGDIIIQPNGYAVNIASIVVKNNGSAITGNSWTSSQNNLPGTWILSPGSLWVKHNSGDYYLEGGGYIAIPNILNNYNNVTVEIKAYGDGSAIARIDVNDDRKDIANGTAATANTYTWENLANRGNSSIGDTRAVQTVTEDFEDTNVFPSFSTGGISATVHTGAFGDWTLYDGTGGAEVYYSSQEDFDNEGKPQAWLPFNPVAISSNVTSAHSGNQYIESICPSTGVASDHWLISPELSGNAQTITFWDREVVLTYGAEIYEVLVSYTDNNPASFTKVGDFTTNSTTWQMKSASLPAGSKYFAIRHTSDDVFGLFIDDITYERIGGTQPVVEGGLVRLGNLPIVDQFKQPIPDDNSHPDTYWYILRYEPEAGSEFEPKESGKAKVDIQKTEVTVHGNYTVEQINNDKDAKLSMDIISADVTMDLRDSDPYVQLYQMQGKPNGDPEENGSWLTRLHGLTSGSFMETYQGTTSLPEYEKTCDADIHHYFSTDTVHGTYEGNNFFTYAPSVSTWGIDRRYFEQDGLDNTYGGPLWKTGAGMVEVTSAIAQKQVANQNNDPNPATSWYVGEGDDAQLYGLRFIGVTAQGYLPKTSVSNIAYEPYMFRVWIESPTGKLRKCKYYEAGQGTDPNKPGAHWEDDGAITGKYWLGDFDINSGTWNANELIFSKGISNERPTATSNGWKDNMYVGVAWDAVQTDLITTVRFYYMTPGWNTRADGPDRPGNGSEGTRGTGSDTGIYDIVYSGEILSTTYVNAQGMKSSTPFDGLNIVITRYTDGTTRTTKVIR